MKQEERLNLDLDMLSFAKLVKDSDDECVFYLRQDGDKISSVYGGITSNITNTLINIMDTHDDAYDIISAAVSLFEEDSLQVIEEEGDIKINNIFLQYNLICSAIAVQFAEKHNIGFESWSGGVVGGKAVFGKNAVLFSDMMYDLENDMPTGVYWQYADSDDDDYPAYCKYLENNSLYCSSCDTMVDNNASDWANDTPVCPYCGAKLDL